MMGSRLGFYDRRQLVLVLPLVDGVVIADVVAVVVLALEPMMYCSYFRSRMIRGRDCRDIGLPTDTSQEGRFCTTRSSCCLRSMELWLTSFVVSQRYFQVLPDSDVVLAPRPQCVLV